MKITTQKGYDFFEVSSSIQKAVRRGDEDVALYFTVEMFNSGYEKYLWKRFKVYASEDIGLAYPIAPVIIQALYTSYMDQLKNAEPGRPERIFLINAVLLLVRAKKSRLVDYSLALYWRGHEETSMAIPDYAFDKHTQKGKSMGRGLDHFYEEGCLLNNYANITGEELVKEKSLAMMKKYPQKIKFDISKKGTISQQQMSFTDEQE